MNMASKALLLLTGLLFLCALMLPAIEVVVLGEAASWTGWRVTALTIWALEDISKNPTLIFFGFTVMGNLVFLIAPWLLLASTPNTKWLRTFAIITVCALGFALWIPHSSAAESPKLLVGYFAWLAAYITLLASIGLRLFSKNVEHVPNNSFKRTAAPKYE